MARNKGKSIIKNLRLWPQTWQKLREAKYNLDISMEDLGNQIIICCLEDPECIKQVKNKINNKSIKQ